ncbi:hypothetical protein Mapa_016794 [Marchantia paleacea]|nr:hypothetical protein Mapa_016794 [Marchantia paleacea]
MGICLQLAILIRKILERKKKTEFEDIHYEQPRISNGEILRPYVLISQQQWLRGPPCIPDTVVHFLYPSLHKVQVMICATLASSSRLSVLSSFSTSLQQRYS